MNGVQSPNAFDRKGARGMGEDRFSHAHNMTTAGKPPKREQRCSLLLDGDPLREASTKYRTAGFGNCQRT